MDQGAIAVIVLSTLAILIDIPPLVWHVQRRHAAICALIIWLVLLNVFNCVNVSIWHDANVDTWWPGYGLCDVEVKLYLGAYLGTTGAVACILRQLAAVVDRKKMTLVPTEAQKRWDLVFMISMCWGFPAYIMVAHYVVQPYRYAIVEVSGCIPLVDQSWVAEVLVLVWPIVFILVDSYYAALVVIRMQRYRSEFSTILQHSNTNQSQYMRRFIMTMIFTLMFIPFQIITYVQSHVSWQMYPYSWNRVHQDWDVIPMMPNYGVIPRAIWLRPVCGFVVFVCTGLGEDAMRMYKEWLKALGLIQFAERTSSFARMSFVSSSWSSFSGKVLPLNKSDLPSPTTTTSSSVC